MRGTAAQIATAEQIIAERIAEFDAYAEAPEPEVGLKRKPAAAALVSAPAADLPLVRGWLASLADSDADAARIIGWLGRTPKGYAYLDAPKSYAAWKASR